MALLTRSMSGVMLAAAVAAATISAAHAEPLPSPLLVAQTSPQAAVPAASEPRQLNLEHQPWTGDFDAMVERRLIRVLVPHSRTLYYNDKGRERGLTAELVRDFERYINQKYAKQLGKRPITVYLLPTTRDKLLTQLVAGGGDIAAGNLTATDERLKIVDFVAPRDRTPNREVIVTGPNAPQISSIEELSGKKVHVNPVSSYFQSVVALNDRLIAAGKAPVKITSVPHELEDEDKLEMLNAGLFDYIVVDDWKAKIWAQVLPKVTVREDLVVREAGYVGWQCEVRATEHGRYLHRHVEHGLEVGRDARSLFVLVVGEVVDRRCVGRVEVGKRYLCVGVTHGSVLMAFTLGPDRGTPDSARQVR